MSKAKEHGALLFNMVKLSKQIFPKYNDEIYRILNKTDEVAKYADMADTLEGATPSEITEESLNLLAGHVANKNNPHEETPESTNTFSAESVIDIFKNKVEVGLSPFDVYGYNLKTWTKLNVNDLFSLSGSKVTVSTHQAIMKGVRYDVVTGVTDLATLASTWNDKTWYVFLRMVEGVATIEFSDEYSAESLVKAYVGSIHTGTGTKSLNPFVRLDTFRLSTNPLGSGIAVGLEGFDSSKGIHLGWRPSTNTLRPERPPKVDIWLINYDKSSNGTSGYIDTAEYSGNPLLQVNQGVTPNINFGIEGDGVTVTASFQNLGGANPTVTKVSNTQFRVSANSYSLSKVTFTAKNQYGDTESLHMYFEVRTNLTVKYGSATNSISSGTQGGLTLITYRVNTDARLHLALTGDGVTTSVSRANTSGSGTTVTKVNQTRYDLMSATDNVMLLTFTATDKYGRTASFSMYVNVRTALPPGMRGYNVGHGYFHRGHIDSSGSSSYTFPQWGTYSVFNHYPIGSSIPTRFNAVRSVDGAYSYHVLTHSTDEMSVHFSSYNDKAMHYNRVRDVSSQRFTGRGVPSGYYCDYIASSGGIATIWGTGRQGTYPPAILYIDIKNILGEVKRYEQPGGSQAIYYWDPGAMSCFTRDVLILMSDGVEKPIVDIVVGDVIMGATGPTRVVSIDYPKLGRRKLLSFNGRCKTSPEHSIWSKCSKTGKEWWSTRDMTQWRLEAETDQGPDFGGVEPYDFSDFENKHLYATLDGFEELETTVHEDACPSTQLYHLITEEGGTYFADGVLVSSMATSRNNIDWTKFQWTGEIQADYPVREWRYPQQDRVEEADKRSQKKNSII